MAPPSTDEFEITNYDVLADEVSNPISSGESDVGLSLAAHSYHVGNNRLEVLCNIQAQAFKDLQAKGDEFNSAAIVEKIMDIVQNQCVPKGRFLERNKKGEWKEVETAKARLLVRQALTKVENQGADDGAVTPKQDDEEEEEVMQKKQQSDAEKKRRRRSSLLRRSVSSSMLPNLMELGGKPFDDKKKSTRLDLSPGPSPANSRPSSPVPPSDKPAARPIFGRSQSVDMGQANKARRDRRLAVSNALEANSLLVKDTLKMDVLFNTAKTALLPGTDLHGNNRLRVMVQIQTTMYQAAKEEDQDKMAETLLGTIENFWGGRILSKVPTSRNKSEESFLKLEKDHAVGALKNLLSGKAAEKEEEATAGVDPNPQFKQGRRASLQAIQSIAASGGGKSASILPSSLPTLPADMQHLRSAAVKSLQKRKQRQGLNSRIRGLTADKAAVFQDGSSNASVMSSSVNPGSTSPIPTKLGSPVPSSSKVISNMPIHGMPHMQQYRQGSSGASVASTASQMSTANSYYPPPPGTFQRQGSMSNASVGGMSTGSSNTQMTMNTMNAARTMAAINLGGRPNQTMQHPGMMQPGMSGPMLGSELQIPNSMMQQQQQMAPQMQQMAPQQMMQQRVQQMAAYQQRASIVMSSVPEEVVNAAAAGPYSPPPLTADQLAQLNQGLSPDASAGQYDGGIPGVRAGPQDRSSLLNSTGSDGLPKFAQGEMDLLIKGLEMAENQAQQQQHPGQGF